MAVGECRPLLSRQRIRTEIQPWVFLTDNAPFNFEAKIKRWRVNYADNATQNTRSESSNSSNVRRAILIAAFVGIGSTNGIAVAFPLIASSNPLRGRIPIHSGRSYDQVEAAQIVWAASPTRKRQLGGFFNLSDRYIVCLGEQLCS